MSALHRHFNCFRQSMREQFDAPPSTETERLYRDLVNGAAPQSQSGASNVDCAEAAAPTANLRWLWSMIALVAAITALLGLWRWSESQMPPGDQMLIAVLPFEAQFADDRLIANGIAEQTRLALSRNASLRILGRATTAAMVAEERPPKQVSRRFGVTHILDGTVRRSGGDVIVSVSLAQTDDGVVIWLDSFRGALNRPFPLQDSIAQGIEGKLRGRLASNGGRRADQIGTTLEVYALYSEARGLLGNRDREGMRRAEALLREAVRRDPNYAPAWSLLGGALHFNQRIAIADSAIRAEAFAAVRRALTLAPNLAQAHATLALLEGDNSPASEPSLRRAIALDPNYAEAWNWLGNSLNSQNRRREALAAYARSLSIDPLYPAAARNFVRTASDLGDTVASNALIRKLTAGGATPALIDSLRADHLYGQRDYSGTIALLRKAGRDDDGRIPSYIWGNWLDTLTSLGLYDELHGITGCPEWYAPMLQARISPPKAIEGKPVAPDEFWTSTYFSTPASRTMIRLGRERELVGIYRAGFKDADDFISSIQRRGMLPTLAPSLAVALTATGARDEGQYILVAAARQLAPIAGRGANAAAQSQLALVRSVQGQRRQALALLGASVQGGWLPDGREVALDLADEPAFRPLRGDPRFEAIRRRILAHIARERAETGPIKV